jgi:tripartite ATP-independent transporter DctP family solute receptor
MKIVRSLAGATMAAMLLAMAASARAQPVELTIASSLPIAHSSFKAMEIFKTEVERRTHNAISVELAPGEQLGSASELVQKGRAGSIFGFWVGAVYMARLVPETAVINLPFVFNNYRDVMRTIDGPAGKLIEAKLDTKGFTTLAWMELGGRNVANAKRPLKMIDDFKNLRLFSQPAETFLATFRALGADPRVIPTREVYGALQRGDIDGMEATYSIINGFKYYEQMKYISDTNHILDLITLVANKKAFMDLRPDQQKVIHEAARLAALQQRKMADEGEAASFAALKTKLQFDPIPPETRVAMRKATAGVINRMKPSIGAELVNKIIVDAGRGGKL